MADWRQMVSVFDAPETLWHHSINRQEAGAVGAAALPYRRIFIGCCRKRARGKWASTPITRTIADDKDAETTLID